MSTLLISDLHLDTERPRITGAFLHFLEKKASSARELYILGDLFESWIGDDDNSELAQQVIDGLGKLSAKGTRIFFMAGNRDFLVGDAFARASGVNLLQEPSLIEHNNENILLMHGDSLCTDDTAYQQFRQQVRTPQWQQGFLAKSLDERRAIASQLREKSREANSSKADYIMDVNPDAVIQALNAHKARLLIHGHTHRPAVHEIALGQDRATRLVLGDWSETRGWYIALEPNCPPRLESFAFNS